MKTLVARIAAFLISTSLIALPVHAQTAVPGPTATPLFEEGQLTAFYDGLSESSFSTLPAASSNGKVALQVGQALMVAFPAEGSLGFDSILYTDDLYLQCEQVMELEGITNVVLACRAVKAGETDITVTELLSNSTPKSQPWKKVTVAISNDPATPPTPGIPSPFKDVPPSHRHLAAIAQLKSTEIIGGYPDGTFRPDTTINRAEFTKIIMGVTGHTTSKRNCFTDVKSEWFAPYVCAAKENGIIVGYPDGSFGPAKGINFAEAVKIVALAFSGEDPAYFAAEGSAAWYMPYFVYANDNGYLALVDQLITTPGVAMTRAQVAQLIANVLP